MSKNILLNGYTPEGLPYSEGFNSYYLAVVEKNKLAKQGYTLDIHEVKENVYAIGNKDRMAVKYTKAEKAKIKRMRAPAPRIRVYTSSFK